MFGDDLLAPLRVLQRRRAHVDAAGTGAQRTLEGSIVADTTGQFDIDVQGTDDIGELLGIGAAAEGRIDIDQVQPFSSLRLPAQCGLQRIAEDKFGAGGALNELDRLAVVHIDRR